MPLEIAVWGVFATPVAAVVLPDAEARNARLRQLILARRDRFPSIRSSNAGGWRSKRDLAGWGGPDVAEILALARSAATQLTADRFGKPVRPAWVTQAWADVNGPGDGGCAADPSLGGAFGMIDPRGPAPAMYAPTPRFAGDGGQSAGSGETILPRPGLLFLFPSWLQRQVRPCQGTELRVSVAFNLGV